MYSKKYGLTYGGFENTLYKPEWKQEAHGQRYAFGTYSKDDGTDYYAIYDGLQNYCGKVLVDGTIDMDTGTKAKDMIEYNMTFLTCAKNALFGE